MGTNGVLRSHNGRTKPLVDGNGGNGYNDTKLRGIGSNEEALCQIIARIVNRLANEQGTSEDEV
jgi:hypothetical protein